MVTPFTPVIRGDVPCHRILEDAKFLAILEPSPLAPGHVVIIPKTEIDHFFDLDDATLAGMTLFAKKVAKAVRQAVPCEKIAAVVYGIKVRHAHLHLIPVIGTPGELDFTKASPADEADLETVADEIRSHLI